MAMPETTTAIEVLGATQTAVALGWVAGSVEQTYRLYRDGAVVYEGRDTHFVDAGLTAGATHTYTLTGVVGSVESDGVTVIATTNSSVVLITDRTAADVAAGRPKGFYNALDLIRVGEAMLYVQGLLGDFGYSVPLKVKLDWQITDIPTHALMRQYIDDVQALRDVVPLLYTTPPAPESANNLTYTGANNIEQILSDIDYVVHHIFEEMFRAGQFDAWSGHRPFPTANSNPGRTWGELDAMQTTWANWQAATWYLLLYGNLRAEGEVS